jgi:hypothetical protein
LTWVIFTDDNSNVFKIKYSILLTEDGRIKMDSSAKARTLFIYLWRNGKFISYCSTDSRNLTTSSRDNPSDFDHGSDDSIEFDSDKDYGLYLGNLTTFDHGEETKSDDDNDHSNSSGGATKVDPSVKFK